LSKTGTNPDKPRQAEEQSRISWRRCTGEKRWPKRTDGDYANNGAEVQISDYRIQ